MHRVFKIIGQASSETLHQYFLPLIGAVRGIRREYRLLDRLERRKRASRVE